LSRSGLPRARVTMGLFFYPRGGSAHVARSLARAGPAHGIELTLAAGSLGEPGARSHAATFFAGFDVEPVEIGLDEPTRPAIAFLPTYEEGASVGERVVARVDDRCYERIVEAWIVALSRARSAGADILHLHHLTPIHEAALRAFPRVPIVTQLHGTELALLEQIERKPHPTWEHGRAWAERMRRWARRSARLIVSAPELAEEARELLALEPSRLVCLANGVDTDVFTCRPLSPQARSALWHRWMLEEPKGWRPGAAPGSVSYGRAELERFRAGAPIVLYVGRYTEVKRLPLLIRAWAHVRAQRGPKATLVLVGGYPGEWEGQHPFDLIEQLKAHDIFLAGWRDQHEVASALNAADLLVLPSARESFGLVLVEAMACGLPVIASDCAGPRTIVEPGQTGWLVPADDEHALAQAITQALQHPEERQRRGTIALQRARERYSWHGAAKRLTTLYNEIQQDRTPQTSHPHGAR
jgi:glycosyltransferase involved in cell wall biosynthesis